MNKPFSRSIRAQLPLRSDNGFKPKHYASPCHSERSRGIVLSRSATAFQAVTALRGNHEPQARDLHLVGIRTDLCDPSPLFQGPSQSIKRLCMCAKLGRRDTKCKSLACGEGSQRSPVTPVERGCRISQYDSSASLSVFPVEVRGDRAAWGFLKRKSHTWNPFAAAYRKFGRNDKPKGESLLSFALVVWTRSAIPRLRSE